MRNEEAIAYWESHGTVPSPESQAATMAALQAQIAALQAQVAALQKPTRKRTVPPKREETSYETVAIDARAAATTARLMALPELAHLNRTMVYQVVEARQHGTAARQIRMDLHWGPDKFRDYITPVVAAMATLPSLPPTKPTVAATRSTAPATRQRSTVTQV